MPRILPAKTNLVQSPEIRWSLLILIVSILLTVALWPTGVEHTLAKAVYAPHTQWAWIARQYGSLPAIIVTLGALLFLLSPWQNKYPQVRYFSVAWLFTVIVGAALVNQVILNELINRARPRDALFTANTGAALLKGHAFPSGHAAVGFVFVAPVFLWLKQKRYRCSLAALLLGLVGGFGIGFSRMQLGAHFFTDVLWAGTLCLLAAVWAPVVYKNTRPIPRKFILGVLLLAGFCMVWFNSFTLTLNWQSPQPYTEITVDVAPCAGFLTIEGGSTLPKAELHLKGYGAPLSQLILKNEGNRLYLQRWHGLYHGLTCEGLTLNVPKGTKVKQTP